MLAGASGADNDLESRHVLTGSPSRNARVGQHRDGDRKEFGGVRSRPGPASAR